MRAQDSCDKWRIAWEVECREDLLRVLMELRQAALDYATALLPEHRRRLLAAYETVRSEAEITSNDSIREAALYAAYQCARALNPLEAAHQTNRPWDLKREIDHAIAAARRAIGDRLQELGVTKSPT